MTVYNIRDLDGFYSKLDRCKGNVDISMPNGKVYNWNENRTVLMCLIDGLDIGEIKKLSLQMEEYGDEASIAMYVMGR